MMVELSDFRARIYPDKVAQGDYPYLQKKERARQK